METRFVPLPKLLGEKVTSAISVVISTSDGPYGALGAHTKGAGTFTGDEVHFLQSVANVLGTMIERRRADVALRESEANSEQGAGDRAPRKLAFGCRPAIDSRGRMKSFASLDCQKVHPSLMKLFSSAVHQEDQGTRELKHGRLRCVGHDMTLSTALSLAVI